MAGSATMSVIDLYALQSPTSSCLAYAAAAAAFFLFGLQTPRTSPSRTPVQPSMWNFALNPEPMKPTPRGFVISERMIDWKETVVVRQSPRGAGLESRQPANDANSRPSPT